MANEYDLLPSKTTEDWERLALVVRTNDHVGHLTSIHNCHDFYDHARPWITHCSVQRIDAYRTSENISEWREKYAKPVVIDECGYEGDLDQGWGNISGQELVRRCWEGAVRGGYVGHGETYLNEREELWWSKGGALVGDSARAHPVPARDHQRRARWCRSNRCPATGTSGGAALKTTGLRTSASGGLDTVTSRRRRIIQWLVDVIDTWNTTIARQPGIFTGTFRIELPGREFMAVRLIALEA